MTTHEPIMAACILCGADVDEPCRPECHWSANPESEPTDDHA